MRHRRSLFDGNHAQKIEAIRSVRLIRSGIIEEKEANKNRISLIHQALDLERDLYAKYFWIDKGYQIKIELMCIKRRVQTAIKTARITVGNCRSTRADKCTAAIGEELPARDE